MLDALEAQWAQHPPVHLLVAAFVGYVAPPVQTPARLAADDDEDDQTPGPAPWMSQAMGAIPGPPAARTAATQAEALGAFERLFFGEVKDVEQL